MGRPKENIDPKIGQRLKQIRKHMTINGKKLSQEGLAELFDKSPKTVQSWESGTRKVPDYVIETMARELGIDEDFIRCKYDNPLLIPTIEKWDAELGSKVIQDLKLIEYIEFLLGHSINDQLDQDELESYLQEIDDFIIFKYNQIIKRKDDLND